MEQYFRNRASVDDDPDLARNRRANDARLKSRFEHIFAKYGKDFDGVGDEIDLETGEIFVNNGHLKNMRHEVDPGRVVSSQVLQVFGNSLERRAGNAPQDNETDEWVDGDSSSASDYSSDGADEEGEASRTARHAQDELSSDFFPEDNEATPRQQQPQHTRRVRDSHREVDNFETGGTSQETSRSGTPGNAFTGLPFFEQSLQAMQGRPGHSGSMDKDTIYALGQSIANQLARHMKGPSRKKPKQRRDRNPDRASPWEYPVLPGDRRSRTPSPPKPMSSSAAVFAASPEHQASIWAPSQRPRTYKRRRRSSRPANHGDTTLAEKDGDVDPLQSDPSYQYRHADLGQDNQPEAEDLAMLEDTDAREQSPDLYEIPVTPLNSGKPGYSANTARRLTEATPRMGPFTVIEEQMIIKYREIDGLSWKAIGNLLPSRSICSAQSHYSRACSRTDCDARRLLLKQGFPVEQFPPSDASATLVDQSDIDQAVGGTEPPRRPEASMSEGRVRPSRDLPGQRTQPEQPGSTRPQVMKSPTIADDDPASRRSARFTPQEDQLILRLRRSGNMTWDQISVYFPGRTPMALHKHYTRELAAEGFEDGKRATSVLDDVDSGEPLQYTQEEDDLIMTMKDEEGMSFDEMTEYLTGRSERALQDRYEYLNRRKRLPKNTSTLSSARNSSDHRHGAEEAQSQNSAAQATRAAATHTPSETTRLPQANAKPANSPVPQTPLTSTKPSYNSSRSSQVGPSAWSTTQPASKGPLPFQPARKGLVPIQPESPWLGPTDPFHSRSVPVKSSDKATEGGKISRGTSELRSPSLAGSPVPASDHPHSIGTEDAPRIRPSPSATVAESNLHSPASARTIESSTPMMSTVETARASREDHAAGVGIMAATEVPEEDNKNPDFTQEQDNFIRKARENKGLSWTDISAKLPGRYRHTSEAITSRYYDVIVGKKASAKLHADTINTGSDWKHKQRYTDEESEKVAEYREKGMSWVQMAALLPGRPPSSIQNHYYSAIMGSAKQKKLQPAHLNEQRSSWSAPLLRQAISNSTRRLSANQDDTICSNLDDTRSPANDGSANSNSTLTQANQQDRRIPSAAETNTSAELTGEDFLDPALRDARNMPMDEYALETPSLSKHASAGFGDNTPAALVSPGVTTRQRDVVMLPDSATQEVGRSQTPGYADLEDTIIYEEAGPASQATPIIAQGDLSDQRPISFEMPRGSRSQESPQLGRARRSGSPMSSPPSYTDAALRNELVHRCASPELGAAYGSPARFSHQTMPYFSVPRTVNQDNRQMRETENGQRYDDESASTGANDNTLASGISNTSAAIPQLEKYVNKLHARSGSANDATPATKEPSNPESLLSGKKRKRFSGRSKRVNSHEVADSDSDFAHEQAGGEVGEDTEGSEEDQGLPGTKRRSNRPKRPRDFYVDETYRQKESEAFHETPPADVKRKRGRPRKSLFQPTNPDISFGRDIQDSNPAPGPSGAMASKGGLNHGKGDARRDQASHHESHDSSRPQLNWPEEISSALRSRQDTCMRTREILDWVKEHHPYFRGAEEPTWIYLISNQLVRNPIFQRVSTSTSKAVWTLAHPSKGNDAERAIRGLDGTQEEHRNNLSTQPEPVIHPNGAPINPERDNTEVIEINSSPPDQREPASDHRLQTLPKQQFSKPQQTTPRRKGPRYSDTSLLRQATAMATPTVSGARRSSIASRSQTPLRFKMLMSDDRSVRAESVARWDAPLGRRVVFATGVRRDDKDGDGEGEQDELS